MVMVVVTVTAMVMVIMVKPFLVEPNHDMGIIYLIIHAYFLTLFKWSLFCIFYHLPAWLKNDHLKNKIFQKSRIFLLLKKKYHNNATLFTNLE